MTWHMLQEERLNMITGCSAISRRIRVSDDSSTSMDREEEEVGEGGNSEDTTSFAQRCIAGQLGDSGFWCASLCSSMVEDEFLNPTSSFTSSFHQSAINNYIDPFYLHHIDNTSLVLVSDLLTETNYVSWSKSMIIALTVKNKICFVDGKIIKSASDSS